MKLIMGLGNPEERYENTRHNIGFRLLKKYAADNHLEFQLKEKFKAYIAESLLDGEKIIFALPTTYYNSVGESTRLLSDFYKIIPEAVLLVHDELALPFGTIRTRRSGSDAGNNGVKSISQHIGPDTARVRIGIHNDARERINDADFVLGKFTQEEEKSLTVLSSKTNELIRDFIEDSFETTTHS